MLVEKSEGTVREECTETVLFYGEKIERDSLQNKYLTRYYKALEWTTRSFFTNPLGMSLKKLRAIESMLLYKPTVQYTVEVLSWN